MTSLPNILLITLLLVLTPLHSVANTDTSATDQFTPVQLHHFINNNQIPEKLAREKKRVMLPPAAIQFDAMLMQTPKPGQFRLVHDALALWDTQNQTPLPKVDHSTFLQATDGRVISVYVSNKAAIQLKKIAGNTLPTACHIYAIHIYNYAKGPRLVVIGATAVGD